MPKLPASTITRIRAYQVDLPLREGRYAWSGGNAVEVFDATVVAVDTAGGVTGWGEACPLGPAYLAAYAAGVRAGLAELAPHLLGLDACAIDRVNDRMDAAMKGHPYVKSAVDVACWDVLGKTAGLPVAALLGGHDGDDVVLYRAISQDTPAKMAASVTRYRREGYRRFQLKVGSDVDTDIARIRACAAVLSRGDVLVADANTGWTQHEALQVAAGVADLPVYLEQPCPTYEQCRVVRAHTNRPMVLDEVIDDLAMVTRAASDGAADVVNLKISKVGGLTKARRVRDLCASLGLAMTIEDTWGGDIVTAAIAHLAHSTPARYRFTSTDFNSYGTVSIAEGAPQRAKGRMAASRTPGLGIRPRMSVLGRPVLDTGA